MQAPKIPCHIYLKNKEGVYLNSNEGFRQTILQSTGLNILGTTDVDILAYPLAKKILSADKICLKEGKTIEVEEKAIDRKNAPAYYHSIKTPLFHEKKGIVGLIGISINITQQKHDEMAKKTFLQSLSHDLRTPFVGINSLLSLLMAKEKNINKHSALKLIQESSTLVLRMLTDLLKGSSYSSFNNLPEIICLNEFFEHIKKIYRPALVSKKIDFTLLGAQGTFNAPRSLLESIVCNLIDNAIKFTEKGKITLTIKTTQGLLIEVEDTGIGIDPTYHTQIFEKFFKIKHSGETGEYQGHGQGLFLAQEYAHQLGGNITVRSQLGKGSRFRCELPFTIIPETPEMPSPSSTSSSLTQKKKMNGSSVAETPLPLTQENLKNRGRILVVEDTKIVALMMEKTLSQLGCEVEVAPDGKTAVEFFTKRHYDLIFMDIGLPDTDGYKVTKKIRGLEKKNGSKPLPILAHSAYEKLEIEEKSYAAGITDIFTKPLLLETVEKILDRYLEKSKKSPSLIPRQKE